MQRLWRGKYIHPRSTNLLLTTTQILEEGKAFELGKRDTFRNFYVTNHTVAGNRWHIDCFRCNTCNTLLDSDANLLLLGDGSLICNNCTYSCSSCGNKIEDLAILTGDQAFCANCFKCRNCKRKIENLRYARTSQGIFCMDCHEALMARRRKKTAKGSTSKSKSANTDKSLPAIPPPNQRHTAYVPSDPLYIQELPATVPELPSMPDFASELRSGVELEGDNARPSITQETSATGGLMLPSTTYKDNRKSFMSGTSELSAAGEDFLIPLAYDPNSGNQPSAFSGTPARSALRQQKQSSISANTSPYVNPPLGARQEDTDFTAKKSDSMLGRTSRTTSPPSTDQLSPSRVSQPAQAGSSDRFQLQDAPKTRKPPSGGSTPRPGESSPELFLPQSPGSHVKDNKAEAHSTPTLGYDASPLYADSSPPPHQLQNAASMLANLPKRGDSLERANMTIPRKELNSAPSIPKPLSDMSNATPRSTDTYVPTSLSQTFQSLEDTSATAQTSEPSRVNGKAISAPLKSPVRDYMYDPVKSPQTDKSRSVLEKYTDPRAPPAVPTLDRAHVRNQSISTMQSEAQLSPRLPRYSAGGDFTLEEDISRILGSEDGPPNESFLRRVSNSVRHGRSHSDRSTGRFSRERWPKSPIVPSSLAAHDISSPTTSSPENREEIAWFKNELRRERQKTVEREKKITELEAQLNAAAEISEVNVQLKEKRSTMVVLDTQKEIIVRELEVLTEHIATTKKSGEQIDMSKMHNSVLRDLAEALQKLKNSFTPQIEALVQQRNNLLEEISSLTTSKDKSFQEFEQLSIKNAQLAEFNNQLVDQIQNIYKTNSGGQPMPDLNRPNGLGIYQHSKDRSQASMDMREARLVETPSILDVGTTYETGDTAVQALSGAQVVEMKKGAVAKRFDWKRGQKMAKGVAKGVKGAFASAQQNYGRDMQFAETGAYSGPLPAGAEYGNAARDAQDPTKQVWLGNKPPGSKNGLYTHSNNTSTPSLLAETPASIPLFGTDLETRCEFERTNIPGIVKRCIAEVEARGLDVEGIYRKSGGNSQVQQIKQGFEKQPNDYDISDNDLDVHAVTSGVKQYFRKLPNPLITYEVYDSFIDLAKLPEGPNQRQLRIEGLQQCLANLPKVHYDTLGFLVRHLAKVVKLEKENLMSSLNVAVVFAPTIMRPESVAREFSDTKAKNEVVMWMIEDCEKVFR